jgi:GH15 family glucan-1,4-alpha-glucosidase
MYNRIAGTPNPWPICSLWIAQFAQGQGDSEYAKRILSFVESHAMSSGILSEQLHPETGDLISVAPLVWSHAEYISTILDVYGGLPEVPHE